MQKILYLIFLFVLGQYITAYSQTYTHGKITYTATSKTLDISNLKENGGQISKEAKDKIRRLINESSNIQFTLSFSKNEALFAKENAIENKKNITAILAGKGTYYTNLEEKIILHKKEAFGENFVVTTPFAKWELTQESKLIGKYKCYKAVAIKKVNTRRGVVSKQVTAWYATGIPVSYGPKEYSGLPGLIIEWSDENILFKATKIELNQEKTTKIKKPTSGKMVSIKEYDEIANKMFSKIRRNN